MKFVEPSVTAFNEDDLQKKVERCYRICYKSEDKMKEDSTTFLTNILNKPGMKHYSPLEHARVCLKVDGRIAGCLDEWQAGENARHIEIDYYHKEECGSYIIYVSTNLRALREFIDAYNPAFDRGNSHDTDIAVSQYAVAKTLHKVVPAIIPEITLPEGTIPTTSEFKLNCDYLYQDPNYQTFRIVTSRDVLQQLARHRSLSPSVESTRFNNYAKKGFECCIPRPHTWAEADWNMINSYHPLTVEYPNQILKTMVMAAHDAETNYCMMINDGCKPQEARVVLPGCLKTELFLTGTFKRWKHFLDLRTEEHVDPQMRLIAQLIKLSLDTDHEGWMNK